MVTAGPGLTNIVSAIAGAYLESRELLVLGGQVKSTDLKDDSIRQRGIQEVDGVAIVEPITVAAKRIERPIDRKAFTDWSNAAETGRKGARFLGILP